MSTKKLKFVKLFHKLKNFSRQKEITKIFFALRAVKFALIAFQELLKSPFEVFGVIYKESWKKYFFNDLGRGRVFALERRVLRFNLGPIHLLDDFVDKILKSDLGKNHLRKDTVLNRVTSKHPNKSALVLSYEKTSENKSRFPHSFWLSNPSK